MLLAFFFSSIAVDWFLIIVEDLVVVRVLFLDLDEKFGSGERATPLWDVGDGSGLAISRVLPGGTG